MDPILPCPVCSAEPNTVLRIKVVSACYLARSLMYASRHVRVACSVKVAMVLMV